MLAYCVQFSNQYAMFKPNMPRAYNSLVHSSLHTSIGFATLTKITGHCAYMKKNSCMSGDM